MPYHIEDALLGRMPSDADRKVGGYGWIQHLAMAGVLLDRGERGSAVLRVNHAARSFVAALQLLARPRRDAWFHLSDTAVAEAIGEYMLPTHASAARLLGDVYERFKTDVASLVSEVDPALAVLSKARDFNLLANVFMNSVEDLPIGVGVYFVHEYGSRDFTDVVVHPPTSVQRYISQANPSASKRALRGAARYYSGLLDAHNAYRLRLEASELGRLERTITALVAQDDAPHPRSDRHIVPHAVAARAARGI